MPFVIDEASRQVVELRDVYALQLLQALDVVVGLSEGRELVCGGQVTVGQWRVDCVAEEDLVEDVYVLLDRLIRVQRG